MPYCCCSMVLRRCCPQSLRTASCLNFTIPPPAKFLQGCMSYPSILSFFFFSPDGSLTSCCSFWTWWFALLLALGWLSTPGVCLLREYTKSFHKRGGKKRYLLQPCARHSSLQCSLMILDPKRESPPWRKTTWQRSLLMGFREGFLEFVGSCGRDPRVPCCLHCILLYLSQPYLTTLYGWKHQPAIFHLNFRNCFWNAL